MSLYPAYFYTKDAHIVVFGGGLDAYDVVAPLAATEAKITVIVGRDQTDGAFAEKFAGRVTFAPQDEAGAALDSAILAIIACRLTDNTRRALSWAHQYGVPVSVIGHPDLSDFTTAPAAEISDQPRHDGMEIYGDILSGNCLKVKWTADYLNIAYNWVHMDILGGACRAADFKRLNPQAQIPFVTWPDGRKLAQSNAIITYLAETRLSQLIPHDPFKKAHMMEWLYWEQYSHEPAIAVRRFQKTYLKKTDDEIEPALMQKGIAALTLMENHLNEAHWLVDTGLTLADISLLAYTRLADEGGFHLSDFPAVSAWIGRVETALNML